MTLRRQLPVSSPLTAQILLRASLEVARGRDRRAEVADNVAHDFGATAVALTDSGTSALVLALRIVAGEGSTVALPAYACVDLIAAARLANVHVRLYDVDPLTLTPDLDSVQRVLGEGVSAIVVAHLYGYPVDVPSIRRLATETGAVVIEDAAQHAGAVFRGIRAGSMGDVTILSFGRGKGTTSGNGGALLAHTQTWTDAVTKCDTVLSPAESGRAELIGAAASWALGRPQWYALPASIPALHLGETVYHPAHEPRRMSRMAASILSYTLPHAPKATSVRRRNAAALRTAAEQSRRVQGVAPLDGAEPGYLRFPVRLRGEGGTSPRLGIVRGYPRALSIQPELQPILRHSTEPLHGAHDLARRLVTLPTHEMVSAADLAALTQWIRRTQ